jgi:SEC-C motif-containing protein
MGIIMEICPCGANKNYIDCCGPFITGTASPNTPEQLMRSRYSAYSKGNIDYIVNTMQDPASTNFDYDAAKAWAGTITWLGLKVIKSNSYQDKGFVEFIASYLQDNKKNKIHEISQFSFIEGKWYYTDGKHYKK